MSFLSRLSRRFSELSPLWIGAVAGVGVLVLLGAGVAAFRTYEWVEHDNDFCLSCHLMVEPYERFARSAHRDLGCKACHMPTFAARSQMALTQVIENPEALDVHAEVPNEKCASCHIEGDPEKWAIVASSAGHRIHFESEDPALDGLQCVECHSSGLHEFSAASETCGQSGCHADTAIQLGQMGNLTIHCTACHGFSDPVEGESLDVVRAALQPQAQECLSCHAMRTLIELPPDEPHQGACGACHNPHEQATPEEAVQSCTGAQCHTDVASLTAMHRGLDAGVVEDCVACHPAHDFRVDAENCVACHRDVSAGGRDAPAPMAALPAAHPPVGSPAGAGGHARAEAHASPVYRLAASGFGSGVGRPEALAPPRAQQRRAFPDSTFRHASHRGVGCLDCHTTTESHGRVTVSALADCRSCHHTGPVVNDCARCHATGGAPTGTFQARRTLTLSVGGSPRRDLPFAHASHGDVACATCHTEGLALSASATDCASCHEDHHDPGASCASCHVEAPESAHPVALVHVGCAGQGCHEALPFEGVPRTRPFCLTCHQDMGDHRPGQACEQCHRLPEPVGVVR